MTLLAVALYASFWEVVPPVAFSSRPMPTYALVEAPIDPLKHMPPAGAVALVWKGTLPCVQLFGGRAVGASAKQYQEPWTRYLVAQMLATAKPVPSMLSTDSSGVRTRQGRRCLRPRPNRLPVPLLLPLLPAPLLLLLLPPLPVPLLLLLLPLLPVPLLLLLLPLLPVPLLLPLPDEDDGDPGAPPSDPPPVVVLHAARTASTPSAGQTSLYPRRASLL